MKVFDEILNQVRGMISATDSRDKALGAICSLLRERVDHYQWVGFYLVEGANTLVLGPYDGVATEHTRIAFGQGICGQAATRGKTFVVQDVSQESNYLSCSVDVRSEIVVPVFKDGAVVGELDIDSHRLAPFSDEERKSLEKLCKLVEELF